MLRHEPVLDLFHLSATEQLVVKRRLARGTKSKQSSNKRERWPDDLAAISLATLMGPCQSKRKEGISRVLIVSPHRRPPRQ